MNKHLLWIASLALGLAACSDKDMAVEDPTQPVDQPTEQPSTTTSNLTTVKLATFAGDPSRVTYEVNTKADELKDGELKLIATIENPDEEVFSISKKDGENGRYMSATSVFRHSDGTYYVSYHMQGNNYNTDLYTPNAGTIQMFTLNEDGTVNLGQGYTAQNRSEEDYDFNHIYFDQTANRIITVGHNWTIPQSWNSETDGDYRGDNTRAIIGVFDPNQGTFSYSTIGTSIEIKDDQNNVIDHADAGDANCVTRSSTYPYYFVATRKGIAILNASSDSETLFAPIKNEDGSRYFIPTPGSCKFVVNKPDLGTRLAFLYLTDPQKTTSYEQSSEAKIAQFDVSTDDNLSLNGLINPDTHAIFGRNNESILDYEYQITLPEISPIDGKNTVSTIDDTDYYVALGKGGLYYTQNDPYTSGTKQTGTLTFGNRPVNCVYAEDGRGEGFHRGFIYVANGAKLTILDRASLEEVANYNLNIKDDNDPAASANYIHVEIEKDGYPFRERTITVAYGQAGVRIFKFRPMQSSKHPINQD